jgi:aquaporin Z
VNPARSLGPALFAGGEPLAHVWLFLLAPLAGAALAFVVVRAISVPLAAGGAAAVAADETGAQLPGEGRVPGAGPPADAESVSKRRSGT